LYKKLRFSATWQQPLPGTDSPLGSSSVFLAVPSPDRVGGDRPLSAREGIRSDLRRRAGPDQGVPASDVDAVEQRKAADGKTDQRAAARGATGGRRAHLSRRRPPGMGAPDRRPARERPPPTRPAGGAGR